ncbi:ribosomal L1 domain-containing protein CG13096-like [Chenopodium quinoa]|uniref:ribosomal L1 domain-containing protein CG13096-like n=1 Tax=Chenopodium quinoa TaxID=63459 RepID=UPI000B77D964|nr:ribosomal L1 domain-containing protein CG13096-like [Chenopodium quinoa]
MSDWEVTELEGQLDKLYSEMSELAGQGKKLVEEAEQVKAVHAAMLKEAEKVKAVHMEKLEEARVLWARLSQFLDQHIARVQSEIVACRSSPRIAGNDTNVGNEPPVERTFEEDMGTAVAVYGAHDGNGDEEMGDQNQDDIVEDEDENDEDDDDDEDD